MGIKCNEVTAARKTHLSNVDHRRPSNIFKYKRYLSMRKRSLTSMGWRYHL